MVITLSLEMFLVFKKLPDSVKVAHGHTQDAVNIDFDVDPIQDAEEGADTSRKHPCQKPTCMA